LSSVAIDRHGKRVRLESEQLQTCGCREPQTW